MSKLVSIIIPTFNRAYIIGETLNSVKSQIYTNWECIIVDDGSTDNTEEVILNIIKTDNRFQYHKRPNDREKGANACRNFGFEISKGDYINWFDDDDLMQPDLLNEKIIIFNEHENIDYVICGFTNFNSDEEAKKYIFKSKMNVNFLKDFFFDNIILHTSNILWKRNCLVNVLWDVNLSKYQDLDYVFRSLFNRNLIGYNIAKSLLLVRIHQKRISNNNNKRNSFSKLIIRKKIYFEVRSHDTDKKYIRRLYHLYLIELRNILSAKNYSLFIKEVMKSGFIGLRLKLYLIMTFLSYSITGKGLAFQTRIINKYSKN